jgi:DNA-directed RNA polymerase specialized sigma24 family protein
MKGQISLSNDEIIRSLKNRELKSVKTLYDNYSSSLLGIISLLVSDEELRLEILEKTFVKIWHESEKYDPINSSLFIWMMKLAIEVSVECMDLQLTEIREKFWQAYKELRKNIQ